MREYIYSFVDRNIEMMDEVLSNDWLPNNLYLIVIPAWMLESSHRDVFEFTPSLASGLRRTLATLSLPQ
jgi:hypothetical protein